MNFIFKSFPSLMLIYEIIIMTQADMKMEVGIDGHGRVGGAAADDFLTTQTFTGGAARSSGNANLTEFTKHRKKRGLIFENGGNIKLVIGPILPIDLADPVSWRGILALYNLQIGEYLVPSTPLYPWDKWENLYARSSHRKKYQFPDPSPDDTREFLYGLLENFMSQNGTNGRHCLLRSICENAQVHQHLGIFSEVLNVILTPGKEDLDDIYMTAYELGKQHIDCLKYYTGCPRGHNMLDQFVYENYE